MGTANGTLADAREKRTATAVMIFARRENAVGANVGMATRHRADASNDDRQPHTHAAEISADAFFLKSVASAAIVLVISIERAARARHERAKPEVSTARQPKFTTTLHRAF